MRWTRDKQQILKLYWQDETDKALGLRLNVTEGAVQKQRVSLGLRRVRHPGREYFVVPVTGWLPKVEDTLYWSDYLCSGGIEHIVAKNQTGYAIFRPAVGLVPVEKEPPKKAWILHRKPKK